MPTVPTLDRKPLYAIAGAGDAAVTALRTRVNALPSLVQVKDLPAQVKELRATLLQQVSEFATKAEAAYDAFAAQGEKAVAARRGETKAATKPANKPATKAAAKKPAAKKPAAATPSTTAGLPESPEATSPVAAAATQQTLNGTASS
jgi:hypothetical protein